MNTFISHFQKEVLIEETKDYRIYNLSVIEGDGIASVYPLFPGMELIMFNINGPKYYPKVHKDKNVLEINYCLSGRAEFTMKDGCLQYIGEGDIFISTLENHSDSIELPLSQYSGIILYIDFDTLDTTHISMILGDNMNIQKVLTGFLSCDQCFLLQARETTINFFAELSSIAHERLKAYYRLKALEILIFLEGIDLKNEKRVKAYNRSQVDIVKKIEKYITDHLEQRLTIDELSQEFCISATALKSLFKEIYGKPISTYMKDFRIQKAKAMLIESDYNISEIATKVGYESQSKFGAVFRNITGLTPSEYRKKLGSQTSY
jgi:AraC-like DNA-binding protein